jgi:hypothetical protein
MRVNIVAAVNLINVLLRSRTPRIMTPHAIFFTRAVLYPILPGNLNKPGQMVHFLPAPLPDPFRRQQRAPAAIKTLRQAIDVNV